MATEEKSPVEELPNDAGEPLAEKALSMSDDDFIEEAQTNPETFLTSEAESATEEGASNENPDETDDTNLDNSESGESDDNDLESDPGAEIEEETSDEPGDDNEDLGETEGDPDTGSDAEGETDSPGDADEETGDSDVDYKAELNRILSPFKANGKEIQVDNVEEAITLMQMGANYSKKLGALKEHLKVVKMLEKNDLLDPQKLNHLIDISKKDPNAISKLLKDSGIDPLDVDPEKADDYRPNNYEVTDSEYELDEVLQDIASSPTYDKTIGVISKQWDQESRNIVVDNPGVIRTIDEHMQNGVFEKVQAIVDKERLLGRLDGVPQIQAYKQVLDVLIEKKVLVSGASSPGDPGAEAAKKRQKQKAVKRKSKRKAAAPTGKQTKKPAKAKPKYYLDIPDDEFLEKYA